ncbi:hypothetical protein FA09DRAFT_23540 [Tilletiopsis washingtonensis]|uniref:Uncharacterized protein n=1 Tax=Tilletiopsis washingtonensis TaxID=58919 RepID=A0A316ZBG7_9BASI|nr:hypothetical protein FA09DRAFT_23540 [Tilletiopsis washingtonensis]PWN98272.1 hypothetical protein FA09DRAFT_23540 [Tilletiopsis washingtonensis]
MARRSSCLLFPLQRRRQVKVVGEPHLSSAVLLCRFAHHLLLQLGFGRFVVTLVGRHLLCLVGRHGGDRAACGVEHGCSARQTLQPRSAPCRPQCRRLADRLGSCRSTIDWRRRMHIVQI